MKRPEPMRRLPHLTAEDQLKIRHNLLAHRSLINTFEGRRDLAIDTIASWALEDMKPSPTAVDAIRDYVEGKISIEDYIANVKADFAHPR